MTEHRPDLLIVGVGVMGRPYLEAAERLGCRVRAVEREALFGDLPGHVQELSHRAGGAEESWLEGVTRAFADATPDGVISFSEEHVLAGTLAAEQAGLPSPSLRAATVSRNKALQRFLFRARGVPQPDFLLASSLADGAGWAAERLPVVVKPLARSGSDGVELIVSEQGLEKVVERRACEGRLLVEEAIEGPEYSWEAILCDGAVLFENSTAKETTPPPSFVELVHRVGHQFTDPVLAAQVNDLTRGVIEAIGMRTGIVHLEFKVGAAGPRLMEIAVRTPGDYLPDAIGRCYEFDLYEALVALALRRPAEDIIRADAVRHTATIFPVPPPGIIQRIDGIDRVREHPAVVRVRLRKQPGDTVAPLTSSGDRMGHVLIDAETESEREEALQFVRHNLVIHTG